MQMSAPRPRLAAAYELEHLLLDGVMVDRVTREQLLHRSLARMRRDGEPVHGTERADRARDGFAESALEIVVLDDDE